MEAEAMEVGPRPSALPLIGAALAAQAAIMVAPIPEQRLTPDLAWAVLMLGPLSLLALGLWRRSAAALLVGVPLGWALSAFYLPFGAWQGLSGAAALGAAAIYLFAAVWWCRAASEPQGPEGGAEVEWRRLERGRGGVEIKPWLGAWLIGGPAVGALLWPECLSGVYTGFPRAPGLAQVGLTLLATLIGLAIASDLLRRRPRPVGRRGRAALLAAIGGLCLAGYGLIQLS